MALNITLIEKHLGEKITLATRPKLGCIYAVEAWGLYYTRAGLLALVMRKCPVCGTEFLPRLKGRKRIYCKDSCKQLNYRLLRKASLPIVTID